MLIGQITDRLTEELKFPVTQTQLRFYANKKLFEAPKDDKSHFRIFDDRLYVKIRFICILAYMGIDLDSIDLVINQGANNVAQEIADEIEDKIRVGKIAIEILNSYKQKEVSNG